MRIYEDYLRGIIFWLTKKNPEIAHERAVDMLALLGKGRSLGLTEVIRWFTNVNSHRLKQKIFGLDFDNPVGIAAGFDKYARAMEGLYALGFGFGNYGSFTSANQKGNPKPRIERHSKERTIINFMGLNNAGAKKSAEQIRDGDSCRMPIIINIAKSTDCPNEMAHLDLLESFRELRKFADIVVVNLSCPNTPEYRGLQQGNFFDRILGTIQEENFKYSRVVPIIPKISPDPTWGASVFNELAITVEICKKNQILGIAGPNTTTGRYGLREPYSLKGGMSGPQCFKPHLEIMRFIRIIWEDAILIMSGGIFTPENALEALRVANLIEVFTSFVYRGPLIALLLNSGLLKLMKEQGVSNLSRLRRKV